jgi:hypothetical protein
MHVSRFAHGMNYDHSSGVGLVPKLRYALAVVDTDGPQIFGRFLLWNIHAGREEKELYAIFIRILKAL